MGEFKKLLGCVIENCDGPAIARRLCKVHYEQARKAGTRDSYPPVSTGRVTTGIEYVRIWARGHPLAMADGYVLEHRKVLYDAGIRVGRQDHVHHINGDKHDNRLENLEVKSASTHHSDHVQEAGFVINQFGIWPVTRTYEEWQERRRANWRRSRAKRRAARQM